MLAHVSIGVSDIKRAGAFYDSVLKPLGYKRLHDSEGALGYGDTDAALWLLATGGTVNPDTKSGLHFCFTAKAHADVDAFHAAALKGGGKDNGEPGIRKDYSPNYYAAFVIDPDGYRLEAFCGK
jgi:catechol 2,3-dioxygenase-like lactoylglutathione lyase family enzyme